MGAPIISLRPFATQRFPVEGATGRAYEFTDSLPMPAVVAIEQLVAKIGATPPEQIRAHPDEYEIVLKNAREIILNLLKPDVPDITPAIVAADFPGEASITILGFLLRRWLAKRQAAMTVSNAIETALALGMTPTPNGSNGQSPPAPIGLASVATFSSGPEGQ